MTAQTNFRPRVRRPLTILVLGAAKKVHNSDLVMSDRQTESWRQQFSAQGIVGEIIGKRLKMLLAQVETLARFRACYLDWKLQVPTIPGCAPTASIPMSATKARPGRSYIAAPCPRASRRRPIWVPSASRPGRLIW